jgi:hypothetical protein
MTEALQYIAGLLVLVAVAVAFYLGGRDTGERRAYATVADLRHQLRVQKLENDRLRDRLNTIPRGDARRVVDGRWTV